MLSESFGVVHSDALAHGRGGRLLVTCRRSLSPPPAVPCLQAPSVSKPLSFTSSRVLGPRDHGNKGSQDSGKVRASAVHVCRRGVCVTVPVSVALLSSHLALPFGIQLRNPPALQSRAGRQHRCLLQGLCPAEGGRRRAESWGPAGKRRCCGSDGNSQRQRAAAGSWRRAATGAATAACAAAATSVLAAASQQGIASAKAIAFTMDVQMQSHSCQQVG